MKTCGSCFFCVPKYNIRSGLFKYGSCYQSNRRVMAAMAACSLYQEGEKKVIVKSTTKKRNIYKDKDGNKIPGMTLPEVIDKPLTVLAKRNYTWGKYPGLAVKVSNPEGGLAIIEITAGTPISALNDTKLPKTPYKAKFVQCTSRNKRKYYTVKVLD